MCNYVYIYIYVYMYIYIYTCRYKCHYINTWIGINNYAHGVHVTHADTARLPMVRMDAQMYAAWLRSLAVRGALD